MKTSSLFFALAALASVGFGQTCTWTGAADGMWTNAANWAEGAVPGRYLSADGSGHVVTNGVVGDTAVFGASGAAGAKTIDLDGHLSVRTLQVTGGADCPQYAFGTSAAQRLGIEAEGTLVAAETSETPPPTMTAELALWQEADGNGKYVYLTNNNPDVPFAFGRFGFSTITWKFDLSDVRLAFRGTGDFCLNGDWVRSSSSERIMLYPANNMRTVTVNGVISHLIEIAPDTGGTNYRFVLGPNGVLDGRGTWKSHMITTWRQLNIVGEGEIIFQQAYKDGKWSESENNFYARYPHELGVRFTAVADGTPPAGEHAGQWFYNEDKGDDKAVSITGENNVTGTLSFVSAKADVCVFSVASFGRSGERSGLGWGSDVRLCDNVRLIDRADSDDCNRTFLLRTKAQSVVKPCLDLRGRGPYVFDSDVVLENLSGSLEVRTASGGSVEWNRALADTDAYVLSLVKSGDGALTLNAANTFTGSMTVDAGSLTLGANGSLATASGLTLANGTALTLADAAEAQTKAFSSLTVNGAVTVSVGDRVALDVASLVRGTDGRLALTTESARSAIRISGLEEGPAPDWITVDGASAVVDADGQVTSTISRWKEPVSGELTMDENWTAGAPSLANPVQIRSTSTTFDVRVDATPATVGAWTVQDADGRVTVAVSNTLELGAHEHRSTQFGAGSRLLVGEGGRVTYAHGTVTESGSEDKTYQDLRPIVLSDGAEWCVDGGTMLLTNVLGRVQVGDDRPGVAESCVRVKSGTFDLIPGGWNYGLELGLNGAFRVEGGVVNLASRGAEDAPLKMRGGKFLASGDALVRMIGGVGKPNMPANDVCNIFSTGETVFSDRTQLNVQPGMANYGSGTLTVAPWNAGETATVRFEDYASITSNVGTIDIGGGAVNARVGKPWSNDQRAIFTYASAAKSVGGYRQGGTPSGSLRADVGLGTRMNVGGGAGYGEFNLSDGAIHLGSYGVSCPLAGGSYTTDLLVPQGRINQSGGTLRIEAYASSSPAYCIDAIYGFTLGSAVTVSKGSSVPGRTYLGVYNLSGGTCDIAKGPLVVGAGYGEGRFVQTGGAFTLDSMATAYNDYEGHRIYSTNVCFGVVGMIGGTGAVTLSNGTFAANSELYVGGVSTNRFFGGIPGYSTYRTLSCANNGDRTDGVGTLTVAGGDFTCVHAVTVGAGGTGILAFEGSAGSFAAQDLVLSNNVASTVRFVADEEGVTTAAVAGKLAIAPGAKLVVDMTQSAKNTVRLFTYATREGDFDPANVTVVDAPGLTHHFTKTETQYRLVREVGSLILIR